MVIPEGILAAGLDDYLTKPLRKALIHERIMDNKPDDVAPLTNEAGWLRATG